MSAESSIEDGKAEGHPRRRRRKDHERSEYGDLADRHPGREALAGPVYGQGIRKGVSGIPGAVRPSLPEEKGAGGELLEGVEALAEVLLDGLAEGWKRQKPWNRSLAMLNDKQMMVCFLGPMLMEDPVCAPLEETLREGWAARWPKEAYRTAFLEKIRKGFRPTFLGITLPFGGNDDEE